MRFAASNNAMAAMGGYSQYQPDQIIGSSLSGRSQTRRAKTVGDMQISIAENEAEAMMEAAALRGAAEKSAANSRGNAAMFGSIMSGVGSFAGPIAKSMNKTPRPSMNKPIPGVNDNPMPGIGGSIEGVRGGPVGDFYSPPPTIG